MAAPSGDDTGETTPTDAVAVASGEEKGSEEAPARLEEAAAGLAGDDDEDEVVEGEVLLELGEDDAPPEDSDDDSGDADGAEAGEGGEGADAGPADNSTTVSGLQHAERPCLCRPLWANTGAIPALLLPIDLHETHGCGVLCRTKSCGGARGPCSQRRRR